mmetsp:Transcript_68845/g.212911  ORF Transcript_68845/g.212911 Transcript_68845/m.212911 type:complete len:135 (-) Transcript_68845:43-447(-)
MLDSLDIPLASRDALFDTLDANCNGTIEISELVQGLLKLRGSADKGDTVATLLAVRSMQKSLKANEALHLHQQQVLKRVEAILQSQRTEIRHIRGAAQSQDAEKSHARERSSSDAAEAAILGSQETLTTVHAAI